MQKCILFSIACLILLGCSDLADEDISIDNYVLSELLNQQGKIDSLNFSFLHISDTHGSAYTLKYFVKLLESSSYRFGLITGDIHMTEVMKQIISSSTKPVFLLQEIMMFLIGMTRTGK